MESWNLQLFCQKRDESCEPPPAPACLAPQPCSTVDMTHHAMEKPDLQWGHAAITLQKNTVVCGPVAHKHILGPLFKKNLTRTHLHFLPFDT